MDATLRRADALIVERAMEDLEAGIAFKVQRIRASGHPIMARALEAAAEGAVSAIQLRSRFREDVVFLLGLAHRVTAGEDPERLADEHVERVLRTRELALIVRVKDPAFASLVEKNRVFLARRLPDLARMAAVEDPLDYVEIVRRAFPERKDVETIIEENTRFVESLVSDVAANPRLLRIPASMMPKVTSIARDIVAWQVDRLAKALDEIYAEPVS